MQLINQIDYYNLTVTSAGEGIIDGSGHFSFLNAVIPERFFWMSCKEEKKPISWYFGGRFIFEFLCHACHATDIISQRRYINWNSNLARMWQSIINVIIETADKIINKQGKSIMLDFFANCSDLCQLTVATSRRTMYISQSLSSTFCRTYILPILSSSQDRTTQIHKEIFTITL